MLLDTFNKTQLKKNIAEIRPGETVRVHLRIKEKGKERIQIFEGLVIAVKHGRGINSTFTVRKIASGVGVERIFPLHSPVIAKIEITKRAKVRRAKLYYMRERQGKRARMKTREMVNQSWEEPTEVQNEKSKEQNEEKEKPEIKKVEPSEEKTEEPKKEEVKAEETEIEEKAEKGK